MRVGKGDGESLDELTGEQVAVIMGRKATTDSVRGEKSVKKITISLHLHWKNYLLAMYSFNLSSDSKIRFSETCIPLLSVMVAITLPSGKMS